MAKFGYEIEAKDKSRAGVEEAKRNLTGLGEAGKRIGTMLKVAFAGVTVAAIASEIKKAINLFGQQEKAEIRLAAAARNNPLLTGEAVKGLKAYASQLQSTSIYGDELIIQQEAFLATLGLSEEQIRKVISAAVDLSSTGMVSLESATRNIAKTFAGMTGELGELIPGLKTLSAEQLKAGEAVDYLSKAYGGMAQAAAQGVSGAIEQTKNLIGDMRESLGAALAPIVLSVTQAVQPIVERATGWLKNHQKEIINLFINLPEVLSIVFKGIWEMIKKVFTLDFWVQYLKAYGQMIIDMITAAMHAAIAIVKGAAEIIWEPLKTGFEWVVYGIKVGINAIIEALNAALAGAHDVLQAIQHPFKPEKRTAFAGGVGALEVAKPAPVNVDAMAKALQRAGGGVWDALKEGGKGLLEFVVNVGEIFAPIGAEIKEGIGEVLGRELKANVTSPVEALTAAIQAGGTGGYGMASGYEGGAYEGAEQGSQWQLLVDRIGSAMREGWQSLKDSFGQTELGGLLTGTIDPMVAVINAVMSALMQIPEAAALINCLTTAVSEVVKIIGPVLGPILEPLVGMLAIMAQTTGHLLVPVLKLLAPIIELVAKAFVWFYNWVIRPLGNAIIWIMCAINNAVAWVINGIIKLLNKLPFVNIKWRMETMDYESLALEKVDYGDLTSAGSEAVSTAEEQAGTGASYTAGRDINVTVNIYTGAIAGDGGFRQLSLMIRDEIFAAEALGY